MTPERLAAIREQHRLFGNETLPEICMNLRMGANGSAEPWETEFIDLALTMLKSRLETWEVGQEIDKAFDNAVKRLVEVTVGEVEARWTI